MFPELSDPPTTQRAECAGLRERLLDGNTLRLNTLRGHGGLTPPSRLEEGL